MSARDWFAIFTALFVILVTVSVWMMWFSRRTMRSQKTQIDEMIHEMREVIDEQASGSDDGTEE